MVSDAILFFYFHVLIHKALSGILSLCVRVEPGVFRDADVTLLGAGTFLVVQWLNILCSQFRGWGFNPWSGNQIPHAATKTKCS